MAVKPSVAPVEVVGKKCAGEVALEQATASRVVFASGDAACDVSWLLVVHRRCGSRC